VRTVIYETDNAIFRLNKSDISNLLKVHSKEYNISQATELLSLISSSSDNPVKIPEKNNYFRYVCLHLVYQSKKGEVTCKICRKSYQLNKIKIIKKISGIEENLLTLGGAQRCGHINWPKWIKRIFTEQEPISNFGRINIQCEKGHSVLIMAITSFLCLTIFNSNWLY